MPLVTQASYARHRGISREAVRQRTATVGGPIPVHGPKKLIDVAEADALWEATMSPQGAANGRAAGAASPAIGSDLVRARAAALVLDVQAKRLALEQRRGALIARDRAVADGCPVRDPAEALRQVDAGGPRPRTAPVRAGRAGSVFAGYQARHRRFCYR
jgi:hypothetical protein